MQAENHKVREMVEQGTKQEQQHWLLVLLEEMDTRLLDQTITPMVAEVVEAWGVLERRHL